MFGQVARKFAMQFGAILALAALLAPAHADPKSLYSFCAQENCADGRFPQAGVIRDAAGNLYGTTYEGGDTSCNQVGSGCGVVFKLAKDGTETVLHEFTAGSDGGGPTASLIRDKSGNLYGTALYGAAKNCGVIFEITAGGIESTLYTFQGGSDGCNSAASLFEDSTGDFFGTTSQGGGTGCAPSAGCGTVFKLAPDGTETILHAFAGGSSHGDGEVPLAGLIRDKKGNFYGTTYAGGADGLGTVFRLKPDGTETVLHSFAGGNDGGLPAAGLIRDTKGNFYGTTRGASCCGTVFKLAPDGTESSLHSFTGENDGAYPFAGLVEDTAGNLYGTTEMGGTNGCNGGMGCGTVFKLAQDGTETLLYNFNYGAYPLGTLILAGKRRLLGSASIGGANGAGLIFELRK